MSGGAGAAVGHLTNKLKFNHQSSFHTDRSAGSKWSSSKINSTTFTLLWRMRVLKSVKESTSCSAVASKWLGVVLWGKLRAVRVCVCVNVRACEFMCVYVCVSWNSCI